MSTTRLVDRLLPRLSTAKERDLISFPGLRIGDGG
ncbi:unnamed protein product [Rhodiola kirilowii]